MWWTDALGPVSTVTVTTGAASLATEVQEFSGVRPGPPLASSVTSGLGSTASVSASPGGVEVGFVAGHGNAEAVTPTTGFTSQPQVQSAGTSIASLVTGYQTPGLSTSFGGTFGTSMYWAAGVVTFAAGP